MAQRDDNHVAVAAVGIRSMSEAVAVTTGPHLVTFWEEKGEGFMGGEIGRE